MALKKKKMYETQLEQVENNILRVNEQQMMLENQRTTVETVAALKNAADASKQTMTEMKINDVDAVLDSINEQNDQMQQIQDAMAQPIGAAADLDEDELLQELEVRAAVAESAVMIMISGIFECTYLRVWVDGLLQGLEVHRYRNTGFFVSCTIFSRNDCWIFLPRKVSV